MAPTLPSPAAGSLVLCLDVNCDPGLDTRRMCCAQQSVLTLQSKYRCCSFFFISTKIAVGRLHPGQFSELSPGLFSDPLPEIRLWSQILRLQNAHLPLPMRWSPA